MKKIAVLVDGGHVRVLSKKAGKTFDAAFVEALGHRCAIANEEIHRILYYDCDPFEGRVVLPVSGGHKVFAPSNQLTRELAKKDLFAIRRAVVFLLSAEERESGTSPAP